MQNVLFAEKSYIGNAIRAILPQLLRLLTDPVRDITGRRRRRHHVNGACIDGVIADLFTLDLAKLATTDYYIASSHVAACTMQDTMLQALGMRPERAHDAVCVHLTACVHQIQALFEDELIHGRLHTAKESFGQGFDLERILPGAYAIIGAPSASVSSTGRSPETTRLLHELPMMNCLNLFKFMLERHGIGTNIANLDHAVLSMAYLYRALQLWDSEHKVHWEDMEFVIGEQGQDSPFVLEATDIQTLARRFSLALGVSATNFAASRKSGTPSIPRAGYVILDKAKLVEVTARHIRANKKLVNYNMDSKDRLSISKDFFNNVAKACDEAEERQPTGIRTPAELCSAFNKLLTRDSLGMNFDYAGFWALCYRFVELLNREYQDALQSLVPKTKRYGSYSIVHAILWQAASARRAEFKKTILYRLGPLLRSFIQPKAGVCLAAARQTAGGSLEGWRLPFQLSKSGGTKDREALPDIHAFVDRYADETCNTAGTGAFEVVQAVQIVWYVSAARTQARSFTPAMSLGVLDWVNRMCAASGHHNTFDKKSRIVRVPGSASSAVRRGFRPQAYVPRNSSFSPAPKRLSRISWRCGRRHSPSSRSTSMS